MKNASMCGVDLLSFSEIFHHLFSIRTSIPFSSRYVLNVFIFI
jgi:hypothetical protein